MFERAILNHSRRPWTMAVSLSLQFAVAGTLVLVSIITIDRLPYVTLPAPLPPLPRAPRPVEVVMTEIARSARTQVSNVFTAPARIPARVAMIVEDVAPASAAEPEVGLAGTGLPGGVYSGGQIYTPESFAPAPPATKSPEPPTRTAEPPKLVKIGGNVLEASIVRRVLPSYPPMARNMRISGTVKLEGIIATDGTVRELKVLSGHPLLVPAAVDAVKQWLYRPTLLNGQPVEVTAPIEVRFTLGG